MFGKSEWFRFLGSVPFPKTREGVWYWAGWLASVLVPAGLMWGFSLVIEMAIWLAVSGAAMFFDMRSLKTHKKRQEELDSLYHITGDEADGGERAETENYELMSR